jgi:hypothetical protein
LKRLQEKRSRQFNFDVSNQNGFTQIDQEIESSCASINLIFKKCEIKIKEMNSQGKLLI